MKFLAPYSFSGLKPSYSMKNRPIIGRKQAFFGRFRLIMGLFLIEYEDFGPETCTKPVGILGEAFYVVIGPRFVSFRYGKAKKGHFWLFSANYGPIFHRI